MATFEYSALRDNKTIVKGKVDAPDKATARKKIREMGLMPTLVNDVAAADGKKKSGKAVNVSALSLREKIDFTSTLEILTSTGIPIIEALLFVEQNSDSPKVRKMTNDFRKQIIDGNTLGETLEKYRNIFGRVYIGLVKTGEDAGELEKTLDRLLELLNKQADIRSKVIGTLMYPMFVILLAMFIVIVMLVFVFPVFKDMFDQMGMELPWITKVLMDMGIWMKKNWMAIPIGFIAFFSFCGFLMRWKPSRWRIDDIVLKIPVLTLLIQYGNFANFLSVMQVAYDAGVPILECLYLANLTLTNHTLETRVSDATLRIQQGQHLSAALRSTRTMPKMILFMIATGEQSGRLGDMLGQAVAYIDKALDEIIDVMTKMIEPIMLIVIGAIVLVLAAALYLPLFASYMGM